MTTVWNVFRHATEIVADPLPGAHIGEYLRSCASYTDAMAYITNYSEARETVAIKKLSNQWILVAKKYTHYDRTFIIREEQVYEWDLLKDSEAK